MSISITEEVKIDCHHVDDMVTDVSKHDALHHQIRYEEEPDTVYNLGFRTFLVLTALSLVNGAGAMSSATNTTLSFQVLTVGGANISSWFANANLLSTVALGPVFGSLSDRIGKKWFLVCGCFLSTVGYAIAGSSHTPGQIIVGQVLAGTGFAASITCIPAINEIMPNKLRPFGFAYSCAISGCMNIAGVYSAGAYARAQKWRWSYYQNAVVFAAGGISVLATYFPPPTGMKRRGLIKNFLQEVDIVGTILLTGSVAAIVIGLTWGGTTYPWGSTSVVTPLVVGCVGFIALGLWEWKGTSTGLFDHRLFLNRNFPTLLLVNSIDGIILIGFSVVFAQEIANIFTSDAIKVAVTLTPLYVTGLGLTIPVGALMARTQRYRSLLVGALVWTGIWTGLMCLLTPNRLHWSYAFTAFIGAGVSVTNVIPVVALTLSVPSMLLGTAGTMTNSARALGGIIGITVMTAIHSNEFDRQLPKDVATAVLSIPDAGPSLVSEILAILANPQVPPAVGLSTIQPPLDQSSIGKILAALRHAHTESWRWSWVAPACFMGVTATLCCFLRPVKDRMNAHIESAMEKSTVRDHQMEGKIF